MLAAADTRALADLARAVREPATFEPASTRRHVRIAAGDGFDIVLLPRLLDQLQHEAPGLDLSIVRPSSSSLAHALEIGEIDLYYGVLPSRPLFEELITDPGRAGLKTSAVYDESWVCVLRRDHPRIRRRVTLGRYVAEAHVVYSPTGGGPGIVDRALESHGRARRVALRVSSFQTALDAVARTELLWTGPRRIAASLDPDQQLLHARPPLDLPSYAVQLVWHERLDAEPYHRWLRRLILGLERTRGRGSW